MGRAQKKPDAKGPLQRLHDRETARAANEPLVSPFAAQHGDYASEPLVVTTGELGSERAGNLRVVRNRGGSTLQRWMSAQLLSETQASAIAHYSRAWHRVYSEPRVTANLSPIAFIRSTGDEAARNAVLIDARELLDLLDEHIFEMAPPYYKGVWQDIVIFDRPAYEAGGNSRASAERSKTICLFIADMIATKLRL